MDGGYLTVSLRNRIIILSLAATLIPVVGLSVLTAIQKRSVSQVMRSELDQKMTTSLSTQAKDVYALCDTVSRTSQNKNGISKKEFDVIHSAVTQMKVGESGYVFVIKASGEGKGEYVISKDGERDGENIWDAKDADGKTFIQDMIKNSMLQKEGESYIIRYQWLNTGEKTARTKVTASIYYKPLDWVIGAGAYEDDFIAVNHRIDSSIGKLLLNIIIGGIIVAIAVFLIAVKVSGGVIRPINDTIGVLKDIAEGDGDLTKRLAAGNSIEVSRLAQCFNTFADKLHEIISQVAKAAEDVNYSSDQFSTISGKVGNASADISKTVVQVSEGSQEQARISQAGAQSMDQLGQTINEVAKGAQTQASMVESSAGSVNQINTAIELVTKLSMDAAENGIQVADIATKGGHQVAEAISGMERIKEAADVVAEMVKALGDSSQQIGEIVETIDDIAEQTNLLALNAAIEAARAGEHGKGFAVVADEVRKLAERSSKATGEISDLISNIQTMTQHAVEAMDKSSQEVATGTELANNAEEALRGIQTAVEGIVKQIQEMSVATTQMNESSSEVIKSIENVSAVTEETTAAAEEMSASGTEVMHQIEQIAAVSEENAAASEQVSAMVQEQNAAIEELAANAVELSEMAKGLKDLVSRFKLEEDNTTNIAHKTALKKAA